MRRERKCFTGQSTPRGRANNRVSASMFSGTSGLNKDRRDRWN